MQFLRRLSNVGSGPSPDKYSVVISGDSAEAVAYALLERIAEAEHWVTGINVRGAPQHRWNKTKEEILDTFAECYRAARGHNWRNNT